MHIPAHLKDFAIYQTKFWAKSAWSAEHSLEENKDYKISENESGDKEVYSVDKDNTGNVQYNMVLSDGLHQFLQLKHGLTMTPESVVTSFVSNVSFFQRFGTKIYGLTGTIGDESSQIMLKDIYEINIGFMPTFKLKQLKELPFVLCNTDREWIIKNAEIAINEANKGRAVLIINKEIHQARLIYQQIVESGHPQKYLKICTG